MFLGSNLKNRNKIQNNNTTMLEGVIETEVF